MIPKIIHYCWFGGGEMPQLAKDCIESWRKIMPDWTIKAWNEDNFDINALPYTAEAYQARKFAFVSDVCRLKALYEEGGVYMDVDCKVFKNFNDLIEHKAFAGIEGSKHKPVMMGVIASEAGGQWIKETLDYYEDRHFIKKDGTLDLTPNTSFVSALMDTKGFKRDGKEQDYLDLHIFPTEYFCPKQTTGEYFFTQNTYCDPSGGISSWSPTSNGFKIKIAKFLGPRTMTKLIKLKRKLLK